MVWQLVDIGFIGQKGVGKDNFSCSEPKNGEDEFNFDLF